MVWMNLFAGQEQRRREQTWGHSGGRRGGTNRESSTEADIPYPKSPVGICGRPQGAHAYRMLMAKVCGSEAANLWEDWLSS